MAYVDGFVIPVKTNNKDTYLAMARKAAEIWKDHGAIEVVECWGDDVPTGKLTSFPLAVKLEEDETVVFSWVTWPDRESRDAGNDKVMNDPRMREMETDMPFDGKRLIFGGFEVLSKV